MRLMTNLLVAVIFVAVTVTTAQAQQATGFVESWNTVSEAGVKPQLNVYVHGLLKGDVGWSAWTLTSEGWSEALVGITYAPVKWIEVSGSLGLESADNPLREGISVWFGKGRWSFLSIHENGGSGYWCRSVGKFEVSKTVAVGLENRRFFGTGPYVEKKLGKIMIWSAYAIGNDKGVAGVRFNF